MQNLIELDLITGLPQSGSDDEYIRQAAERLLLDLGYEPGQVAVDHERSFDYKGRCVCVRSDLVVSLEGRPALVIGCRRGSLVSREKETLAQARLIFDPWVPYAMVFNGEDSELMDTASGEVLQTGLEAVPSPDKLAELLKAKEPVGARGDVLEMAVRVYEAYSFIQCPGKCTV